MSWFDSGMIRQRFFSKWYFFASCGWDSLLVLCRHQILVEDFDGFWASFGLLEKTKGKESVWTKGSKTMLPTLSIARTEKQKLAEK